MKVLCDIETQKHMHAQQKTAHTHSTSTDCFL